MISEKRRAQLREANARYRKTEKYRKTQKRYNKSKKGYETRARHNQTEKRRASRARYKARPGMREHWNVWYQRSRRLSLKIRVNRL